MNKKRNKNKKKYSKNAISQKENIKNWKNEIKFRYLLKIDKKPILLTMHMIK